MLRLESKSVAFRDRAKIPHYHILMQHIAACRKVQSGAPMRTVQSDILMRFDAKGE